MKKRMLSAMLAGVMAVSMLSGCGGKKETAAGEVTIDFLSVWQGDSGIMPSDQFNNVVAQKIKEATGVTVNILTNNSSELEKLNITFSSGEMPDLISGPFWGGSDATTLLFKKAAKEGMLMPLDELVEEYAPELKSNFADNLTEDFRKYDVEDPEFEGKHYFFTCATPVSEVDGLPNTDADGLYIRKDIYEAIGVDGRTIDTSEELYEVLKKIRDGGFKDANGKDIIPGGMGHSGSGEGYYYESYNCNTMTGYHRNDEGKLEDVFYSPWLDKTILFMRRLYEENLIDKEGLTQNSSQATEKVATGRYGLYPASPSSIKNLTATTLLKTNPEMEYIPFCRITPRKGKVIEKLNGSSGAAVLCIPSTTKKAEAVIKVLKYLNSDEGDKLVRYGIEGVHYELDEDGFPEFTPEWNDALNNNPKKLYAEGILGIYGRLLGPQLSKTRYGRTPEKVAAEMTEEQKLADEIFYSGYETKYIDGVKANYFEAGYPDIDYIRSVKAYAKMVEARLKGYFADTEEEALSYTNDLRKQIKEAGVEKLWSYMEEKLAGEENILF